MSILENIKTRAAESKDWSARNLSDDESGYASFCFSHPEYHVDDCFIKGSEIKCNSNGSFIETTCTSISAYLLKDQHAVAVLDDTHDENVGDLGYLCDAVYAATNLLDIDDDTLMDDDTQILFFGKTLLKGNDKDLNHCMYRIIKALMRQFCPSIIVAEKALVPLISHTLPRIERFAKETVYQEDTGSNIVGVFDVDGTMQLTQKKRLVKASKR